MCGEFHLTVMTYDVIHIGTSGWGERWCREFLPPSVDAELIDVVAAVDIDESALSNATEHLGVPADRCYTDIARAFSEHDPDFCTIVVPPGNREDVVNVALAHDAHILSEKPISDSLDSSIRIAKKVERAEKKMGVTMSHRFDRDKTTLRQRLRSGTSGQLDYLVCRFTNNARRWRSYRHNFLVESGVHHLDLLENLANARCERLYAQTWLPKWGKGTVGGQTLVNMTFENDTRAIYEAATTNAACLNNWEQAYIRAECHNETLTLDRRKLKRFPYNADDERNWESVDAGDGEPIPLADDRETWANVWLIEQFVEWLDGGESMETNVQDNLRSMALVEAALRSSETGDAIAVQELLADAKRTVTI